ncbi:MAG: hypothetical protein V3W34_08440 [Phycisphaerae bacterium]
MTHADVIWIIALTLLIETVTCVLRFGVGWQSTRDTAWMGRYTLGIRIHHAYLGVVVILLCTWLVEQGGVRSWALAVGVALILSDLIHHFVVLWIFQGDPQFDLTYPRPDPSPVTADTAD